MPAAMLVMAAGANSAAAAVFVGKRDRREATDQ